MKNVKAIIVGFGVVGKGVAKVLQTKRKELEHDYNAKVSVVAVCNSKGCVIDESGAGLDLEELVELADKKKFESHKKFQKMKGADAIESVKADILIEATPTDIKTGEPGTANFLAAFKSGKHVITSNKGPLAVNFQKLMGEAKRKNLEMRFEATVCGGMPVFSLVRNGLQLNKIKSVRGILNGTTNFILTKMLEDKVSFESALKEAQELGYAEADPTYDIEGIDAAAKVVILANALLGINASFKDVKVTGITKVTAEAMELANSQGFVIKLIGEISESGSLEVSPRLIPKVHPLNVKGSLNALQIDTDLAKEVFVVGRGAGQIETASAIVSDLVDIINRRF
ncbi:Homoserine dehydrogenase [Candidatus Gugararchaeum adminiculabundum]|nr:Homoserine dehydrogenase [Candidatus Gugararchaeum adminiculabundum]